jgi:hypothetical protein
VTDRNDAPKEDPSTSPPSPGTPGEGKGEGSARPTNEQGGHNSAQSPLQHEQSAIGNRQSEIPTPQSESPNPQSPSTDETTHSRLLPTWPRVYLLVTLTFLLYVLLLTAFQRAFS